MKKLMMMAWEGIAGMAMRVSAKSIIYGNPFSLWLFKKGQG
jgi:hypothetical protein